MIPPSENPNDCRRKFGLKTLRSLTLRAWKAMLAAVGEGIGKVIGGVVVYIVMLVVCYLLQPDDRMVWRQSRWQLTAAAPGKAAGDVSGYVWQAGDLSPNPSDRRTMLMNGMEDGPLTLRFDARLSGEILGVHGASVGRFEVEFPRGNFLRLRLSLLGDTHDRHLWYLPQAVMHLDSGNRVTNRESATTF